MLLYNAVMELETFFGGGRIYKGFGIEKIYY